MDETEKFKVWDKVKVVRGKHGIPIGTTGFISEIYRSYPFEEQVKITYRFVSEFDNDYQGMFNANELELCEDYITVLDKKISKEELIFSRNLLKNIMTEIENLLIEFDDKPKKKKYIKGVMDSLKVVESKYEFLTKKETKE